MLLLFLLCHVKKSGAVKRIKCDDTTTTSSSKSRKEKKLYDTCDKSFSSLFGVVIKDL